MKLTILRIENRIVNCQLDDGTIIDIEDDTVIVEFGNNKNCRIPMQKAAIADVEKAGSAE